MREVEHNFDERKERKIAAKKNNRARLKRLGKLYGEKAQSID